MARADRCCHSLSASRNSTVVLPLSFIIFLYSSAFTVAVPLDPDDLRVDLGEAHPAGIGSLVIRERMHFFTLPEDPFMARKIKPQRAQRITESCYFYLSPPLCHSVSSVVFRKPYFENIKSLRGFGHRNAR